MATPRESHDNGNDNECQRQDEKDFGQSEGHTDMVYQSRPFVVAGRSGLDVVRRAAYQNLGASWRRRSRPPPRRLHGMGRASASNQKKEVIMTHITTTTAAVGSQ